jgi:hypothetical protein
MFTTLMLPFIFKQLVEPSDLGLAPGATAEERLLASQPLAGSVPSPKAATTGLPWARRHLTEQDLPNERTACRLAR